MNLLGVRLLAVLILLQVVGVAGAQVSLLPEHQLVLTGIKDDRGRADDYTVLRDWQKPKLWYYVPNRLRLIESGPATDPRPAFQLMAYQSKQNDELLEGGVLQFSVSMALSATSLDAIRKAIAGKVRGGLKASELTIAPIPISNASATIYGVDGHFLTDAPQAPGLTPSFVTQTIPFQARLSKFGTDLVKALTDTGSGGIGTLVTFTFNGCLPPAGFEIEVDWDNTFRHVSESNSLKIGLQACLLQVGYESEKKKIREELVNKSCIKVVSTTNEAVRDSDLDPHLDRLLQMIMKELIESARPPPVIEAQNGQKPNFLQSCFSLGVSHNIVMKDVRVVKKGKERISFERRAMVPRTTAGGAFIGINGYSPKVKETLVNVMPPGNWGSAYLLLPPVADSPGLNLTAVRLTASVVDADGQIVQGLQDTGIWSAASPHVWKDKDGDPVTTLKFPLQALFDRHKSDPAAVGRRYRFKLEVGIDQRIGITNHTVNVTDTCPIFDGDVPLATPMDLVDAVSFDLSLLSFGTGPDELKRLSIVLRPARPSRVLQFTHSAPSLAPANVVFLVEAARPGVPNPIIPTVTFQVGTQSKPIPWAANGKDLHETVPGLAILFTDADWHP